MAETPLARLQVTCAIIIEKGKLLACRRAPGSSHALEWEFPGGKLEANETPLASVVREIKEELNVEVDVLDVLQPIDFDYTGKHIRLIPFLCSIKNGVLTAAAHDQLQWISPDEFATLHWSGADRLLFETNLKTIMQWI